MSTSVFSRLLAEHREAAKSLSQNTSPNSSPASTATSASSTDSKTSETEEAPPKSSNRASSSPAWAPHLYTRSPSKTKTFSDGELTFYVGSPPPYDLSSVSKTVKDDGLSSSPTELALVPEESSTTSAAPK